MENTPAASELLWEVQQRADRARKHLAHRAWLKNFVLVFGLIVVAVAIAMVLANWGGGGSASLGAQR